MSLMQVTPPGTEVRQPPTGRMKVLAVGAQKGGVGKSTTALYLATRAAESLGDGTHPVVGILDRDESKNLSRLLKFSPDLLRPGVVLLGGERVPPPDCGLKCVVVDTPPGVTAIEALRSADLLVVPVLAETQGVMNLLEYLKNIEDQRIAVNPRMQLLALLPTMVDGRMTLHRRLLKEIERIGSSRRPPLPVLSPIPRRSRIAEYHLDARDYDAAAKELFAHGF